MSDSAKWHYCKDKYTQKLAYIRNAEGKNEEFDICE